jgi:hypothetical protein
MAARREKEREGEQVPPEDVSLFEKIGMEKIQPNLCKIALSGERSGRSLCECGGIPDASDNEWERSRECERRARHIASEATVGSFRQWLVEIWVEINTDAREKVAPAFPFIWSTCGALLYCPWKPDSYANDPTQFSHSHFLLPCWRFVPFRSERPNPQGRGR